MKLQFARFLSLAVLIISGVLGVHNGVTEWGEGRTALQHSVTLGVLLYGVLGLLTTFGIILKRSWSATTAIAWGVMVTYVPVAAIIGYAEGHAPVWSALTAGLMSAAIAAGVVWTARAIERQEVRLGD